MVVLNYQKAKLLFIKGQLYDKITRNLRLGNAPSTTAVPETATTAQDGISSVRFTFEGGEVNSIGIGSEVSIEVSRTCPEVFVRLYREGTSAALISKILESGSSNWNYVISRAGTYTAKARCRDVNRDGTLYGDEVSSGELVVEDRGASGGQAESIR